MAKLSDLDRQKLIDQLTTNCDIEIANIYGKDDVETLKGFDDVKLFKLAASKQALIDNAADPEEDEEEDEEEPTENAKKKAKKPDPEEDMEDEGDDEEMETNSEVKPVKPLTDAEWLAQAPKSIRSVVQNALRREAEEKQELIENMVANVAEEDQAVLVRTLNSKSMDELRVLQTLRPSQVTEAPTNYVGNSIPMLRGNTGRVKRDEPLMPPTINWGKEEE